MGNLATNDVEKVTQSVLLNLPVAGDIATANGYHRIKGLRPIRQGSILSISKQTPVVEVQGYKTVAMPTTPLASTKYGISFGYPDSESGSVGNSVTNIAITTPSVLTGTALTDRQNIAAALASRINRKYGYAVYAGLACTITHGATSPAGGFALYSKITGGTSGAIGYVVATTTTTATVVFVNGIISAGTEALSGTAASDGVSAATATLATTTFTGNLGLLDVAGYCSADHKRQRVFVPFVGAGAGIPASAVTVVIAGVKGVLQGTRMLDDVHIADRFTDNLVSGLYGFAAFGEVPVAGSQYYLYKITVAEDASMGGNSSVVPESRIAFYVYARTAQAGTAAFDSAILALT